MEVARGCWSDVVLCEKTKPWHLIALLGVPFISEVLSWSSMAAGIPATVRLLLLLLMIVWKLEETHQKSNTKSLETETPIKTSQQIGINSNLAKMRPPATVHEANGIFHVFHFWDTLRKLGKPCFTCIHNLTLYKAFPYLLLHLLFNILWKGKRRGLNIIISTVHYDSRRC